MTPPSDAPDSGTSSAGRAGRLAAHAAVALVAVVGVVAQIVRPVVPQAPQATADRWFSAAEIARAEAYRGPLLAALVTGTCIRLAIVAAVAWTPGGRRLVARIVRRVGPHRTARAAAAVVLAVVVGIDVLLLPLNLWAGHVREVAWGLRTAGLGEWFLDWLVAVVPGWLGVGVLALAGWWIAERLPRTWPAVAALAAGGAGVLVALLAPVVLEPLVHRTVPLAAGPQRAAVEAVLARAGVAADTILVADASRRTTRQNAYVSGLGATRRVVLYDTLLEGRTPAEVAMVFAHELGHDRHHDVARSALLGAAGAVVAAYGVAALVRWRTAVGRQARPTDPAAAAVVLAVVTLLVLASLPVQSVVSRRAEAAADDVALELTRDPAVAVAVQRALALANLSDPDPPRWAVRLWGSHPPAVDRLAAAEAWRPR